MELQHILGRVPQFLKLGLVSITQGSLMSAGLRLGARQVSYRQTNSIVGTLSSPEPQYI